MPRTRADYDDLKQQLEHDLDNVRADLQQLFDLVNAFIDREQLDNRRRLERNTFLANREWNNGPRA